MTARRISAIFTILIIFVIGLLVGSHLDTDDQQPKAPTKVSDMDRKGDDNGDGTIMEDESGWNCHTMGNRICGPGAPADGFVNR